MNRPPSHSEATAFLVNGRLPTGELVDIDVVDGLVSAVRASAERPTASSASRPVHDLGGWLVLPAMAEPHAHLDKALTSEFVPNPSGDLLGAIEGWGQASNAGLITREGIIERAIAAMDKLVVSGVTAVRTHVNVLPSTGADVVTALQEARTHFDGVLDVQIVGLVSFPMVGPEGAETRAAMRAALEAGLDLIGGCPHLEADGQGVIDLTLAAADEANIGVDLHVDETLDPSMLTLEDLARTVIERGYDRPVTASHCVSLGVQSPHTQAEVSALVAEAGVSVVALPQTNLFLQGRDHSSSTPRGLTAVAALTDAGAVVSAGGDNVQDPFNLVGRSDPLETAALMVMAGHRLPEDAYDLVSNRARATMGLPASTVTAGDPADLVAIDAPSIRGAIADAPMSRRVFRRGRLVAQVDHQTSVHRANTVRHRVQTD